MNAESDKSNDVQETFNLESLGATFELGKKGEQFKENYQIFRDAYGKSSFKLLVGR